MTRIARCFKKPSSEEGQSTIEFALTMILLLAVFFFYIQLSMVLAFGNYVHYATFMAARAYLASSDTEEEQKTRARQVIVRMLKKSEGMAGVDKFPAIARGTGGGDPGGFEVGALDEFKEADRGSSWMLGVRYRFRSRLFLLPLGREQGKDVTGVNLVSESWLGRETTGYKCRDDITKMGGGIYDNGC